MLLAALFRYRLRLPNISTAIGLTRRVAWGKGSTFTSFYCEVLVRRMVASVILYERHVGLFRVLGNAAFSEPLTSSVYLLSHRAALK